MQTGLVHEDQLRHHPHVVLVWISIADGAILPPGPDLIARVQANLAQRFGNNIAGVMTGFAKVAPGLTISRATTSDTGCPGLVVLLRPGWPFRRERQDAFDQLVQSWAVPDQIGIAYQHFPATA